MKTKNREDELANNVNYHDKLYWDEGRTEISDTEYDTLVEELRSINPLNPAIANVRNCFFAGDKVKHIVPMLSLNKAYSTVDIIKWINGIKFLNELEVIATPKADGVAAGIRYDKGRLYQIVTRGDGEIGEDITLVASCIPNIPKEIKYIGKIEIRGEICMYKDVFLNLFSNDFSNPRNLASGILKGKELEHKDRAKYLSFVAYDCIIKDEVATTSDKIVLSRDKMIDRFEVIKSFGFETIYSYGFVIKELSGVESTINHMVKNRELLPFEADGIVFRVMDIAEGQKLGMTGHHPKHSIAFKFASVSKIAKVVDVEWNVSRTGIITPVVIMQPVDLDGAMVHRATAHNFDKFEALKLKQGDSVEVIRSGGVIPYILKNVGGSNNKSSFYKIPDECPSCGAKTIVTSISNASIDGSKILRCSMPEECNGTNTHRIFHYAHSVNANGFGKEICKKLVAANLIKQDVPIISFYSLQKEQIACLQNSGEGLASNLIVEIEKAKTVPMWRFLKGLCIEHVGENISKKLAVAYPGGNNGLLKLLLDASTYNSKESDLAIRIGEFNGCTVQTGEIIAKHFVERYDEIVEVITKFVTIISEQNETKKEGKLSGQSFVFTGALEHGTRTELQEKVRALGGETPLGVSQSLTFLVVGTNKGEISNKEKKARKLSTVNIISEHEFTKIIEE